METLKTPRYTIPVWIPVIAVVVVSFFSVAILPPARFPTFQSIEIPRGATQDEVGAQLHNARVIRSPLMFSAILRVTGNSSSIRAGVYEFERPLNVFAVAKRLVAGETGAPLVTFTVPEGKTVREIATQAATTFINFDANAFLREATPYEGYLFPETYLLPQNTDHTLLLRTMREQFERVYQEESSRSGVLAITEREAVIMASLLEKEARLYETKQIVAGILWKRIEIGMPLQVDAVFGYILGTDTFNPTFDDLEIDSPYNTYKNIGLPPGAISNPGRESLRAALNPVESPYLYYLTGSDGVMHYGRTFEEHIANRRFLR